VRLGVAVKYQRWASTWNTFGEAGGEKKGHKNASHAKEQNNRTKRTEYLGT